MLESWKISTEPERQGDRTSIDPRWSVVGGQENNRKFSCENSETPKVPRIFKNTVLDP